MEDVWSIYLAVSSLPPCGQQIQEGRLSAARGPHDTNHLTRVEVDGDTLQNLIYH